jgi:hypothetical protein
MAIANALVQLGYAVFLPIGHNHRYDFLLDLGDRIVRVQCKTGRLKRGVIRFNTVSTRGSRSGVHRRSYAGEADLFAVHCPQNHLNYLVPVDVPAAGIGCLRVAPAVNGQRHGITWAADYQLPDWREEPTTPEPETGFEPVTPALQEQCSTN